jgi:tetratricopeptide (TPR) repeat protein
MADVNPDSYRVHQLLAESYEARREIPAAVDEYKLALERAPSVPGLNYALANLSWREGSLEEAEIGFKKELAINDEHYLATWKLGNIYLIKREIDKAMPYLLKAIEQKPQLAQAHRDLGRAYSEKGDFQKAMEHFRLVTKLSPEEPTVHYRMALIHKKQGNKEEETKEIALFRKLKKASDDREKRATMVERVGSPDETEKSKKDADIQPEVN